jgi:feruloyl-CoA synthase
VRVVVLAGPDRDVISALVFPDIAACRKLTSAAADASDQSVLDDALVRALFADRLASLAKASTGSSMRVVRLVLMAEPPSMDKGEATDKGSINQRAVLKNRAALVEALYAAPPPAAAITLKAP